MPPFYAALPSGLSWRQLGRAHALPGRRRGLRGWHRLAGRLFLALGLGLAALGVIGYVVQSTFTDGEIDPRRYCKGFPRLN